MQWFIAPSFFIAFIYAIIMVCFFIGWNKLKPTQNFKHPAGVKLSVLIALRNEESNISNLIQSLIEQDFPMGDLEVLLVDDHSTDNTLKILQNTTDKLPQFHILSLPEGQSGKKAALRFGLANSSGEILVLTDGDCQPGKVWLTTMINAFSEEKTGLVLGPVILAPAKTRIQKLMQLEYMSMVVSGAGSTGIGRPILAFGPNMAIKKNLYTTLVKEIKDQIPSGDDMFILEAAKRNPGIEIKFVRNNEAIVSSPPPSNLPEFWNQRKRWISKSGSYKDKDVIAVSILVYLMNFSIFISLILAVLSITPWWIFLLLMVSKTVCEYPLMNAGARFFHLKGIPIRFLLTQTFYFFYIIFILPAGMVISYKWKNRKKA